MWPCISVCLFLYLVSERESGHNFRVFVFVSLFLKGKLAITFECFLFLRVRELRFEISLVLTYSLTKNTASELA